MRHRAHTALYAFRMVATLGCLAAHGSASAQTTQELKRMSLEEVLSVPVTTLSRGPEAATIAPAAVHVITREDILRSGARSIPEALRLAPGVQVARINAGTWSIGVRGFADRLARSMLVLIDGRAVYSPLFAGTYWEVQDTLLEDIERIEVIRGPGGTLWGANAVNGIINIITRPAADTLGSVATAGGGSQERAFGTFRYGASAGNGWNYRIYGKATDRAAQFSTAGDDFDGLRAVQSGFRADWMPPGDRRVTIQGDIYGARLGERATISSFTQPFATTRTLDAPLSGGNVLARWSGASGGGSRMQLQTFYARTRRDEVPVKEDRDTADLDFQHTLQAWNGHQLTWGAGYRVSRGRITAVAPTEFVPAGRTDNLYTGFIQDDMAVRPDRLRLILGAKLERNDYSGMEFQPSGRVAWTPSRAHTAWWSMTRAVRTPSRVETDYTTASLLNPEGALPLFVRLLPNPDFSSEKLIAYETGYRIQPAGELYFTVSGFYNVHDDVLSTEILPAAVEPIQAPARIVIPVTFGNTLDGRSHGVEVTADARPFTRWRWTANYSYGRIQLSRQEGSLDGSQERRNEGSSPRHQIQLTSSTHVGGRWSIDAFARYVSPLAEGPVPAYWTTNVRAAWAMSSELELSVVAHDLNQPHHAEWPGAIEIERGAYVRLAWSR